MDVVSVRPKAVSPMRFQHSRILAATAGLSFSTLVACSGGDPGATATAAYHPGGSPTTGPTHPTTSPTTPAPTTTSTTPPKPMTADETWADGKIVAASVMIMAGATVTIAPGATVTIADGATITVAGTLQGTSAAAHSKLTSATTWGGITVASGGALALSGVDISNATTALHVVTGAASATVATATVTGATTPFNIEGGKLALTHVSFTGTKGSSSVGGELDAKFMDYDAGSSEGISASNPAAILSIEDSKLHGAGTSSGDMISVSGAASLHIAYTEIHGAHCAFHFNSVVAFDVSYMTIHDNSYGFMLYGSGSTGTRTISMSNIFSNVEWGADEGSASTVNGLITIENGYWALNGPPGAMVSNDIRKATNAITVTAMSSAQPVPGVGPRGAI